ncbi:hypothetical protein BKA81DRAFT_365164 [Phyllosticta paracitricarpa]
MTTLGFAFGATLPVYRVTACCSHLHGAGCHAFPTPSPRWGNRTSQRVYQSTTLAADGSCKPGSPHEAGGAHHVGGALMKSATHGPDDWHLPRATPAGAGACCRPFPLPVLFHVSRSTSRRKSLMLAC